MCVRAAGRGLAGDEGNTRVSISNIWPKECVRVCVCVLRRTVTAESVFWIGALTHSENKHQNPAGADGSGIQGKQTKGKKIQLH